jgi:2-polyprenyl-3-methyl-5-hydroxy-6-metoxy-1,4-benzoquinol methylase
MKKNLDQAWPIDGLEDVEACPFCRSIDRTLAYDSVQDWSFECAPGRWQYWDCVACKALYLHPRPTRSTIGSAYGQYYTHTNSESRSVLGTLKDLARNECLSHLLKASIEPRMHVPKLFKRLVASISHKVAIPFGWRELAALPKGEFMDVGCGAGLTVSVAKQLGWQAMGLEIDPVAVSEAQRKGLNIVEGAYDRLSQYPLQFDCIMVSHVLEHVHDPLDMLATLKLALKPNGVLLISLPNALSVLRYHFGANWRGLEAPRHLAIPSQDHLKSLLTALGFVVEVQSDARLPTAAASFRIGRRGSQLSPEDLTLARNLESSMVAAYPGNDFIKFACRKAALVP